MNILVVSPHPDDETLGAGGTILRLMQEGNAVSWLNITGIQGNPDYSTEYRKNRERQLNNIEKFYDFSRRVKANWHPFYRSPRLSFISLPFLLSLS